MPLSNKRIFIFEDNLNNRAIMQTLLEKDGATVAFDRWGKNGIRQIKKFMPIDLILMDLNLPNDVSGFDVFQQIRLNSEYADIPIVAITADNNPELQIRAYELGLDGYILKPIRVQEFNLKIATILNGGTVWDLGDIFDCDV